MRLTRTERWILHNQYRILELLSTEDYERQRAREAQEALSSGYTILYKEYCPAYDEGVDESLCREVLDILSMYDTMTSSKTGVDPARLRFPGFDGNNETEVKCLSFAKFFCDERYNKRFAGLDRPSDFNSHAPMLHSYRAMLEEWNRLGQPRINLSLEQVERILNAGGL